MKSDLEKYLDYCDDAPFRMALARIEECTYTDENGKKRIDGKKLIFGLQKSMEIKHGG